MPFLTFNNSIKTESNDYDFWWSFDVSLSKVKSTYIYRALQFIPVATWLVRKHFLLANKSMLYVTCQINKDTNSYYTTPICIYLYIIDNALNETEDAQLRNGLLLIPYLINIFYMFQNFIMINKTFTFKLFLSGNKFGFASNIWACLSTNITIYDIVTGIISEPQKLQTSGHHGIWAFQLKNPNLHHYFGFILPLMLHQKGQLHDQLIQPVYF